MAAHANRLAALLLCLACAGTSGTACAADPAAPPVVHTQEEWQAVLALITPTPLDALSPYGKRRFIATLRWGERGLGGFSYAPLVRELDREQLAAVLRLLDSETYLGMLEKQLAGAPLRLPAPSMEVEQNLQALERYAREQDLQRENAHAATTLLDGTAVLERYQRLFGARLTRNALRAQPVGDLLPLFDAAAVAAQDSPDSRALADLLAVHAQLAARGVDTRRTLDGTVLGALLAARRFDEARAFAAGRPLLAGAPIPQVVDTVAPGFKGRSVFEFDAARNTMTRRALPARGMELVMVIDGGCHFSRDALQALRDDAALRERLLDAGLVLTTPPHAAVDLDFIAGWNLDNPGLPIRIPYHVREWQAVAVAGVPAFILLKDGKPTGRRVSGWPEEGNQAALLRMLDGAGPAPDQPPKTARGR